MLELADRLRRLLAEGTPVVAATAIDAVGSAPSPLGTSLVITASGAVLGSVSAGCIEDRALEACSEVLLDGTARVARYGFGISESGASCGGELDVLVHPLDGRALRRALDAAAAGHGAALAVVVAGPPGALGAVIALDGGEDDERTAALDQDARDRLRTAAIAQAGTGRPGLVHVECGPATVRAFVDTAVPASRLVLCGATETVAALASIAAETGWVVTVCDPREALVGARALPSGVEVVVAHAYDHLAITPLDARDAVCLLGHDEELDPLAAAIALERGAGYVGALGSRATTLRRRERMRLLGVPDSLADRLHAPIGLDLGAAGPAETAVSILAELTLWRRGGSGRPLRELDGPIHRPRADAVSAVEQSPDPVAGHRQLHRA